MSVSTMEKRYTAEDLLTLPEAERYEVSDGRLVELNMGAQSGMIGARLMGQLYAFVTLRQTGYLFTQDGSYQIFSDDQTRVRKPDISYIRRGRLPDDRVPRGHIRIPPDMLTEVVSPNDLAEDIETRVTQFLRAGALLIWVIYPLSRTVYVYRQNNTAARLTESDTLDGEDVLPGFSCPIAPLFEGL